MKETGARTVNKSNNPFDKPKTVLDPIADLDPKAEPVEPVHYAYRSFDRQWALPDKRLCDRHRPTLQKAHGDHQVYLTSFLTEVLGEGPAATATAHLPDLHHFRGSYGGRHVIPLWRDQRGEDANLTHGVLDVLAERYDHSVEPEDLFGYTYAVLSAPKYVEHFWEALEIPGPRMPITKDAARFNEAVELGRKLLWLHTYGEHFVPDDTRPGTDGLPQGTARLQKATPTAPEHYPDEWHYDEAAQELRIGDEEHHGVITGVSPAVMNYSVSGFQPVKSWLDYRMKSGAGRTSSPLDDIRPQTWSFDSELQDMLWVLESTLTRYDRANDLLSQIIEGDTFSEDDFPDPTDDERKGPDGNPEAQSAPLFDELE